ncbi:MAG: uroporphyrinogen decarboxylase, partial [Rickettsiales bacterium]|nr:uroporphyrinogen decarboxylase [Rickettsiales bacterium]
MKNKPLLQALRGKPANTPPLWLMRQAGRYLPEYRAIRKEAGDFLTLCYTPELAAEVTLQPIRRFGFDAAIIFSDILVIPDAMGVPLKYVEGKGPVLEPVSTDEAIQSLKQDTIEQHLAPVAEALKIVAAELPEQTTLIGFAGAPWTVATYMLEGGGSKNFATSLNFAYTQPASMDRLITMLTEATITYLRMQIHAGAEVIQLFDSWAGALPEPLFERYSITPAQRIVAALKQEFPDVPIIGFP